ncbi:hypothetical protein ERJ75_001703800 [Trypanosoma vivax]|nr:hypothetical protein ERJ75_001703800 [Trypanosoma vivax]
MWRVVTECAESRSPHQVAGDRQAVGASAGSARVGLSKLAPHFCAVATLQRAALPFKRTSTRSRGSADTQRGTKERMRLRARRQASGDSADAGHQEAQGRRNAAPRQRSVQAWGTACGGESGLGSGNAGHRGTVDAAAAAASERQEEGRQERTRKHGVREREWACARADEGGGR